MLLGELSDVFRVAIGEYYRFNIDQLIRRTITVLSWKGTPEAYAYPDEAYRMKAEAEQIIQEENDLLRTSRARSIFGANLFANLLPSDVARQIRSFLTVDIALSAPTTEAQFLLLRFQSTKTLMENFIQVANSLGFYPFPLPRDQITLTLRLPQALFGSDLARLGDSFKVIDEFFGEITEETTGVRGKPTVQYASDAVLTLYLSIEPRHALPVMYFVRACIDTAKSAIAFESALGEMRKTQVGTETIDEMVKAHEATQVAELVRAVETAVVDVGLARQDTGRARDPMRVVRLCLRMARYMEQGLEIHLMRPLEPKSTGVLSAEPLLGFSDIHRLLADTTQSQAELNARIQREMTLLTQDAREDKPRATA